MTLVLANTFTCNKSHIWELKKYSPSPTYLTPSFSKSFLSLNQMIFSLAREFSDILHSQIQLSSLWNTVDLLHVLMCIFILNYAVFFFDSVVKTKQHFNNDLPVSWPGYTFIHQVIFSSEITSLYILKNIFK